MRWTFFSLLVMAATFLVGFIHADIPRWTWAESLPFSTTRAFHATVLFELALAAQIATAIYFLFAMRRWRLQAPEIRDRPVAPRDRVWSGFWRLTILLVVNLLALWAGTNMDVGLRFRDLVIRTLGVNPNHIENVAAFCTLGVVLLTVVLGVYLFFGSPRAVPASPVVIPSPPPPGIMRPAPPMPPRPPNRP